MADDAVTEFKLTSYVDPRAGRLAVLTMDNGAEARKPCTMGRDAIASLASALDALEADDELAGVLLTGKPFSFAAGADLHEFVGVTPEFAEEAARGPQGVLRRLADLPVPTMAAINGVCLGGALELALHCDYRTIAATATPVGFPEVFLSILPAWGGTQLATRLVGVEQALQVIVHNPLDRNRTMRAPEVVERGLADRLLPAVDFLEASRELLAGIAAGEERIERDAPADDDVDAAVAAARQAADDRVHGATPAPYRAIEVVEFAARGGDLDEGLRREAAALAELLPARHAQASVYAFDLTQRRVRRQPGRPEAPAREVRSAAVVGAGLMGAQIASLLLQRLEVPLAVKDIDEDVLDRARGRIEQDLDKRVARGRLHAGKADFLKSIVTYSTDDADLAGADLVVEAVAEVLEVKRKVLAGVEAVVDEGAVLATNTSALSVSEMAAGLARPERLVGMHFWNPIPVMPLVELVRAERTGDQALATAFEVAKQVRKSAVLCADAPAFVGNRMLLRFMGACIRAVDDGTDFADVDDAVKALGLPMGPFELLGLVGLEVYAHVADTLHAAFPDRFPDDPNVRMLAEAGLPGVYDWSQGRVPFPQVVQGWRRRPDGRPWSPEEIRDAALEAAAEEAGHILDDGVVADARDIDTCMLLGTGFPFFHGGICPLLDETGVSERVVGRRLVGAEDRGLPAG